MSPSILPNRAQRRAKPKLLNKPSRNRSARYQAFRNNPLLVLSCNEPITIDQYATLDVEARMAWEKLRTGIGSESEWDTLSDVCNVCSIACDQLYKAYASTCSIAAQVLQAIQDRADRTGLWGACHQSIQIIPELIELHAALLESSTPKQMMDWLHQAKKLKEKK